MTQDLQGFKSTMINQEKLKLACELAQSYNQIKNKQTTYISFQFMFHDSGEIETEYELGSYFPMKHIKTSNLDFLISKLEKMIAYKNRYEIGETIYYIHPLTHKPTPDTIKAIKKKPDGEMQYEFTHYAFRERQVYATQMELIEDQIEYWQEYKATEEKQKNEIG